MTENVTNERLLKALKAIQSKLTKVADDIADLKTDMRGVKGHMAAFMQSRVERIERRLELHE